MAIYPSSVGPQIAFALTNAEKLVLKQHLVTALEKNIAVDQDRALFALKAAMFEPKRTNEIHAKLWEVCNLEAELITEVNKDMLVLEEAYADGAEDKVILAEAICCKAVDASIFADRFIKVKRGEKVTDPVVPIEAVEEKPIAEEPIGGEEIIKP